jgi:hypothetical protein
LCGSLRLTINLCGSLRLTIVLLEWVQWFPLKHAEFAEFVPLEGLLTLNRVVSFGWVAHEGPPEFDYSEVTLVVLLLQFLLYLWQSQSP